MAGAFAGMVREWPDAEASQAWAEQFASAGASGALGFTRPASRSGIAATLVCVQCQGVAVGHRAPAANGS
jgi:hypothetical protein